MTKVLLVDDDSDQLFMFKLLIEKSSNCEVFATGEIKEAFELLKSHSFGYIISDVMMPELNGVEFSKKAKLMSPDATFILLTAAAFEPVEGFTIIPKSNAKNLLVELLQDEPG